MRRQLLETSTVDPPAVDALPDKLALTWEWKLQSVWLSLSLSTANFRLFVAWGKPENISRVDFLSKHPIIQLYQATLLGFLLVLSVK